MAVILNTDGEGNSPIYLNAYHCFGRSVVNADTAVEAPEVSRIHAVIEWHDKQWFIRDLSTNGTWVNNKKLVKDSRHTLTIDDKIFFASNDTHCFVVKDLGEPQNILLGVDELGKQTLESPIILSDYNLLPSEEQPEVVLFYAKSTGQWYKELLADTDGRPYPVADQDTLIFGNQRWQINLNSNIDNTVCLLKPKLAADQIKYRFNLSLDEKNIELTINTADEEYYLSHKAHHLLTLCLAKHRNADAKRGLDELSQGWVTREALANELGYDDILRINTHVHRAKNQFIEKLAGACEGDDLIERQGNKIRFAGSFYRIYKGCELIINSEQGKAPLRVING